MMSDNQGAAEAAQSERKKKRRVTLYVFLIRWWSAGAVYFFVAWGTGLGQRTSIADLVFFLGLILGFFNSLVVNPILKSLFDIGWHKSYANSSFGERMAARGKDLSLALASTVLVSLIYRLINTSAVRWFDLPEDQVFLPGEPILFGLFFVLASMLLLGLLRLIRRLRPGRTDAVS